MAVEIKETPNLLISDLRQPKAVIRWKKIELSRLDVKNQFSLSSQSKPERANMGVYLLELDFLHSNYLVCHIIEPHQRIFTRQGTETKPSR